MDHYLDIELLPDPEFPSPILMNALFAKLHRVLVELNNKGVGVSFPKIESRSLGGCLRLHGANQELCNLNAQPWLKGLRDHTLVSDIQQIPKQSGHCQVKRVQAKSNAERLRRRYRLRHPEIPEQTLLEVIPDKVEKKLDIPYVRLKSKSSGQDFLLFIHQSQVTESRHGSFNAYGLSASATLPWF